MDKLVYKYIIVNRYIALHNDDCDDPSKFLHNILYNCIVSVKLVIIASYIYLDEFNVNKNEI